MYRLRAAQVRKIGAEMTLILEIALVLACYAGGAWLLSRCMGANEPDSYE